MINKELNIININDLLDKIFLVGGFRIYKGQYKWIMGIQPERSEKLYNVRFSPLKESCRDGSVTPGTLPDFVLLHEYSNKGYKKVHLFKCLSYSVVDEREMQTLGYPSPKGSYILYKLGEEYCAQDFNITDINKYAKIKYPFLKNSNNPRDYEAPYTLTGEEIRKALCADYTQSRKIKDVTMVDLFAGLGGFHLALKNLGKEYGFNINCVFASELKEDLRHLYEKNYGIRYEDINSDITLLDSEETIRKNVPEHTILCGGFPCQPFSKAGKQEGFNDKERGVLFNYIADIIKVRRPKYIFLENVSNLETHDECRTWQFISAKLSNPENEGGLNYDIAHIVLSPHEYGYPQHRKRIYIVGIDRNVGNLHGFTFPIKPENALCNIQTILEDNPTNVRPVLERHLDHVRVWQEFLDKCRENKSVFPHAPIWAMEFGANYDYENLAPAYQTVEQLRGKRGHLGKIIKGNTVDECLSQIPNYAQTGKDEKFPDWKIKFIKENRRFYEENKNWLKDWVKKLEGWDNSFMKLEWNCPKEGNMRIDEHIVQFRPSGIRVKQNNYSPALTFVSSQVPILMWMPYEKEDGTKGKGRFMTVKEAARVQGMGELSFEGLAKARIYEALGNAVDVEIIKMIAKQLFIR